MHIHFTIPANILFMLKYSFSLFVSVEKQITFIWFVISIKAVKAASMATPNVIWEKRR